MCEIIANKHLGLTIGFIVLIGLLVAVIFSIRQHNKALRDLQKQIKNLGQSANFTFNNLNIENYTRFTAYIAILFCIGVAIHYMANGLPRILDAKAQNTHIQNLGVDYLGLIVAIFAIIVTLLVGWQIFSTIKAKEELKEARDNFEKEFGKRIYSLDERVFKLSLRNNSVTSTINIGTYFEILNFTLMANSHDFKTNNNTEPSLRLNHLQRDVLSTLRGLDASNEIADCNTSDFKFYAAVAKKLNEKWLITYVRKFFVFDDNNQKITPPEKEKLFDEA